MKRCWPTSTIDPEEILEFWIGKADAVPNLARQQKTIWYRARESVDQEIRARFSDALALAEAGDLEDWRREPRGTLALIILLDQFSRHIFRGMPAAFRNDTAALEVALGFDDHLDLGLLGRVFAYHPFKHAEDLSIQQESLIRFDALVQQTTAEGTDKAEWRSLMQDFYRNAVQHHRLINQYGRFPHRNDILNRRNTEAEALYLQNTNARFGQRKLNTKK